MKKEETPAALATRLLAGLKGKGLEVQHKRVEREQADLHAVRVGGKVVALVLARRRVCRLQVRDLPAGAKVPGDARSRSKDWAAGFAVTPENLAEAKELLRAAVRAAS